MEVAEGFAGFGWGEVGGWWPVGVCCGVPEGGHEFAWLVWDPGVGALVVDEVQACLADGQWAGGFGECECGRCWWSGGGGGTERGEGGGGEGECGEQVSSHTGSVAFARCGCLGVNPDRVPRVDLPVPGKFGGAGGLRVLGFRWPCDVSRRWYP